MVLRITGLVLLSFTIALAQHIDDRQAERLHWFYSQRAYPNGSIPAGARRKAILELERIDAAARAQRQAQRGIALGTLPFALTTDAVTWRQIGPQPTRYAGSPYLTAGRVNAIAIDPRDNNVVYIGAADGGVWKTLDGGVNWTPLTDNQPSLANGSITLDPSHPDTIYVGTGEENFSQDSYYGAGILKSTDGGQTWTNIVGPFDEDYIGAIAVHPTSSQVVLCAAQSGVWRSADAGNTWTATLQLPVADAQGTPRVHGVATSAAISVVFDPSNGESVYATLGRPKGDSNNGLYHSTDGGQTWTRVTGTGSASLPTSDVGRVELAIAPSSPATMYVQISSARQSFGSLLGVYKTSDAGTTWTKLNTGALAGTWGGQLWYDNTIRVSPKDPNVVWAGGLGVLRSLDGGTTWNGISQVGPNGMQIHVDFHHLAFTPDGSKLYLANDGGVFSTTDITTARPNWTNLNGTLSLTQFYPGMSMDAGGTALIGGAQDNGTQLYDGVGSWTNVTCGDGGFTAMDLSLSTVLYAACQDIQILRAIAINGSVRWHESDSGIDQTDNSEFIPPMVIDPSNPQTLYFGTYRLWQSLDGTGQWTAISPDLSGAQNNTIRAIAVAPSDPNTVYAGTRNSFVQVTTNALQGARAIWTDRSAGLPSRVVTAIAVDPLNSATVYVTFSGFLSGLTKFDGYVYRSTDGGATWTNITGNLPNLPVNDIAVDPDLPNTLYIATDAGVMVTTDGGNSWSSLGNGLPRVVVHSLVMSRKARLLRAGTHGRSVWEIAIPLSTPSLQPAIGVLTPYTVEPGSSSFTLGVTGSNFVPGTVIRWNGLARKTTFVDAAQVNADISAADVAAAGRAVVTAFNSSTGGGASLPANFNIGSGPQISAAGFVSAANPTGGNQLAPLSIGSLYGKNLAPLLASAGKPPLPFTMQGVTLTINGAFAPLFFVSPGQINFQVPNILSSGAATVTLTIIQGAQSTSVPVVVKPFAPSLFTTNAQGTGQAATVIAGTAAVAAPAGAVGNSRPAKVGEFISIYCTGLGQVTNSPGAGYPAPSTPLARTQTQPTVTVGGIPATVPFAGLAPGFAGLYQVNVQVPDGVTPGDAVPVALTIGGVASNTATIAVQ
jgi:uncharacterized protein (TIGR03437 family)